MKKLIMIILILLTQILCKSEQEVKHFFSKYKRPVTFIDLTRDFISQKYINLFDLESVFLSFSKPKAVYSKNCIFVDVDYSDEDLKLVSECEYFDCVVVDDLQLTKENFYIMCALGDYLCVYSEGANKLKNLCRINNKEISEFEDLAHKVLIVHTNRSRVLENRHIFWKYGPDDLQRGYKSYEVFSSFGDKYLIKKEIPTEKFIKTNWAAGINLLTYIYLGLNMPDVVTLKRLIYDLKFVIRNDWSIVNMVVCGNKIVFIDNEDFHYEYFNTHSVFTRNDNLRLNELRAQKFFELLNIPKIYKAKFFWEKYNILGYGDVVSTKRDSFRSLSSLLKNLDYSF